MTAMAAVDRLTHRGIVLEFELEHSIRAEQAPRPHLNGYHVLADSPADPPRIGRI